MLSSCSGSLHVVVVLSVRLAHSVLDLVVREDGPRLGQSVRECTEIHILMQPQLAADNTRPWYHTHPRIYKLQCDQHFFQFIECTRRTLPLY